jgi:hypothetical protein
MIAVISDYMVAVKSLSDLHGKRGGAALKARLRHIDDRLVWFGFFRLAEHIETFQISEVQGKIDLQTYRGLSRTPLPDRKAGRPIASRPALDQPGVYELPGDFVPVFPGPRSLDDLLETTLRGSPPRRSFAIETIEVIPAIVEPDRVRFALAAADLKECCYIDYQSLTSSTHKSRIISPHTLVKASSRWHLRAYDFNRRRFVDFSLSRIRSSSLRSEQAAVPSVLDDDWNESVDVNIIANPSLSSSQQKIVEHEVGMKHGTFLRTVRKPLLFYLLDELRLLRLGTLPRTPPSDSRLWIQNSEELVSVLGRMQF